MRAVRKVWLGALCAGLAALGSGAGAAQAAAPEPDFILTSPLVHPTKIPPPILELEGPCGIAVRSSGHLFVANYYRHSIESIAPVPSPEFSTPLTGVDPLDGPCGLAVDGSNRLYVNNYHRNVERYTPLGQGFGSPTVIDSSHPTGVAADTVTGRVYVAARTHIAVYDADSGAPVMDGADPLRIGEGEIEHGYGAAVSRYTATAGFLYVPDAATGTVKVFDSADGSVVEPAIAGPPGGFGSLRDSAVAVDRVTGDVYVADTLAYPQYTETPQAVIQVFDAAGAYKGQLKYPVVDSSPVGLAVDNSAGANQGRVYVTSGNTTEAKIYAYPPGAAIVPQAGAALGPGAARARSEERHAVPAGAVGGPHDAAGEEATASEIAQKGKLRVAVSGRLSPRRLPRRGTAPVSISVGGEVTTTDGSSPPQLKRLRIEFNRGGRLESAGLPTCRYGRIQPGSSSRALSACREALVGRGSFTADITLSGQEPYPTRGRLLVFNGARKGKPVLFGHLHSRRPFATSFVLVFERRTIRRGPYGTALAASLPQALGNWGNLTGIEMTLSRRYTHRGARHSFISAGCPAPKGFPGAVFPLARTSFTFSNNQKLTSVLTSSCRAKG
jgi:DNA-binding beta-propeller fold protein YncE